MDITDKEILDSALTDELPEAEVVEQPQAEQPEGQPRDDHGRFAARQEAEQQPEAQPEPQAQQPEANVPSWRLREERERAEAAERRFQEAQTNWQRQLEQLQTRLPQPEKPKAPDVFEDPNGFLNHGVREAINPIQDQIGQLREFYSRKEAIREHGQEKVTAAYNAIAQGMQNRDPEAQSVYQRAMASMDPFGEIVGWHQQKAVFSQIGNDPNAWFEKELERRMADPKFAASQFEKIQQSARGGQQPQGNNLIQLPPSLNKVPTAQSASDDDGDMSDGALFRHAMR